MASFEDLPVEVLIHTVIELPINEILNLCESSQILYQKLCNNQTFWQSKYNYDFGTPNIEIKDWKMAYQSLGQLWSSGNNYDGQLGLNDTINRAFPEPISTVPAITNIATGYSHSICLDLNGEVWCFGNNYSGQLGLGDCQKRIVPTKIHGLPKINAIDATANYSLVLDNKGTVWKFGENIVNGSKTPKYLFIPTKIDKLPKIKSISAGTYHALFLDFEGTVWGIGSNYNGELGFKTRDFVNTPTKIPNLPEIKMISAGQDNSFVMDLKNQVWVFGSAKSYSGPSNQEPVRKYFKNKPTRVTGIPKIKTMSNKGVIGLLLDFEGGVWAVKPFAGVIVGHQTMIIKNIPKIKALSSYYRSLLVDQQGYVWEFDTFKLFKKDFKVKLVPNINNAIKVSAGSQEFKLILNYGLENNLFGLIRKLIYEHKIISYRIRSDLNHDTNFLVGAGSTVAEFINKKGNNYFVELYFADEIMFPPLETLDNKFITNICQNLDLEELNRFRESNLLYNLPCRFNVRDQDNQLRFLNGINYDTVELADVVEKDGSINILVNAAYNDGQKTVQLLLENGMNANVAGYLKDYFGRNIILATPLLAAIYNNSPEIVKILLDSGVNPNFSVDNRVPLIEAIQPSHQRDSRCEADIISTKLVKLLLDAGADPNTQDSSGRTALFWARNNDYSEIVKLLQ